MPGSARFAWALIAACNFTGLAAPVIPKDEHQVLEKLPAKSSRKDLLIAPLPRSALANDPENLKVSVALAKRYIEQSRADSDPRYLGYAQATLRPWWDLPRPPGEILVLRATIRQSNHDFDSALADLALALKADPANAQAWLTRATILQVRGEFEEAKRALVPLEPLAPELITVTCRATIGSLNGEAAKSYEMLTRAMAKNYNASVGEHLWSLTALAEIAARLDKATEAEAHFKQALSLRQRDGYLLGAYADFLLDQGRPDEVVELLKDETRVDALLLRLALAKKSQIANRKSQITEFENDVATLRSRFAASRQRGDTVHRREEARFALHLQNQPREALRLAKENWSVQREPADVRILLESALAAKDAVAAQPVLDWLARNRLEDMQLAKLTKQLAGK